MLDLDNSLSSQMPQNGIFLNNFPLFQLPNGTEVSSTSSTNDTYHLLIPTPPSGGTYKCRLPLSAPATSCLPSDSPLVEGARVDLDQTKVTFAILSAQQGEIRDQLTAQVTSLTSEVNVLKSDNMQLKAENRQLQGNITQLRNDMELVNASCQCQGHNG